MKIAYGITERDGKSYWTRIGVAFVNKDGSINVKLDFLPAVGQDIQLRDQEDRDPPPESNKEAREQGRKKAAYKIR